MESLHSFEHFLECLEAVRIVDAEHRRFVNEDRIVGPFLAVRLPTLLPEVHQPLDALDVDYVELRIFERELLPLGFLGFLASRLCGLAGEAGGVGRLLADTSVPWRSSACRSHRSTSLDIFIVIFGADQRVGDITLRWLPLVRSSSGHVAFATRSGAITSALPFQPKSIYEIDE
jgi:hypothetical protein